MKTQLLLSLTFLAVLCSIGCNNSSTDAESSADTPIKYEGEVFIIVDEMPRFKDCDEAELTIMSPEKCAEKALLKYVYDNVRYPDSARTNNIAGRVVTRFVVNTDGKVSDAEVLRGLGHGCDEEALRIVNGLNSLDPWIPGKKDSVAVRVQFTLPIEFSSQLDSLSVNRNDQDLFAAFIFCRDFMGDFFSKSVMLELSEAKIDNNNLCVKGLKLKRITVLYEEEGKTAISARGAGWTQQVKEIFKNAESGGVFKLNYTLEQGGITEDFQKVLMVE